MARCMLDKQYVPQQDIMNIFMLLNTANFLRFVNWQ